MRIERIDVPPAVLGEGPIWSERDGCLYFVDIPSHRVLSYSPSDRRVRSWQFDTFVASISECRSGGLLVALGQRLVHFDPEKGESSLTELVVLEGDRPRNRLNDGKTDPHGRFWVGSLPIDDAGPLGRLWIVSANGVAEQVRDGITCSNGLAFDRARGRVYFVDSPTGVIERADLDAERRPGPFQPFASASKGTPDGSCTDAAGFLWNAEWGGQRLCRYSPDGLLERVLELPVSRPTCCTFGGARYRTLFVTSARAYMTEDELAREPEAGSLFAIELDDAEGLPADLFAL